MALHVISNQFCIVAALSMALLFVVQPGVCGAYAITSPHAVAAALPPQLLWNELLANGNDDLGGYYPTHLKKLYYPQRQQQQPQSPPTFNYLAKWPGLRDLLLTNNEYDENSMDSNEQVNMRFAERLRQLGDNVGAGDFDDEHYGIGNDAAAAANDLLTAIPAKKYSSSVASSSKLSASMKDHGTKKNVQYMSPCHFKICNMGRKRNAQGSYAQY